MAAELERARRLRDEAYHLRVITRELRNRASTLAKAINESCKRLDAIVDELETPTPKEAHGNEHRNGNDRARELEHAAG